MGDQWGQSYAPDNGQYQMNPYPPQYAQQQPPPPPPQMDEKQPGSRFKPKLRLRDPIFFLLFLAVFFAQIGLSAYVPFLNNSPNLLLTLQYRYALYQWNKAGGNGSGFGPGSTANSNVTFNA